MPDTEKLLPAEPGNGKDGGFGVEKHPLVGNVGSPLPDPLLPLLGAGREGSDGAFQQIVNPLVLLAVSDIYPPAPATFRPPLAEPGNGKDGGFGVEKHPLVGDVGSPLPDPLLPPVREDTPGSDGKEEAPGSDGNDEAPGSDGNDGRLPPELLEPEDEASDALPCVDALPDPETDWPPDEYSCDKPPDDRVIVALLGAGWLDAVSVLARAPPPTTAAVIAAVPIPSIAFNASLTRTLLRICFLLLSLFLVFVSRSDSEIPADHLHRSSEPPV